jgi:hypothetical protein
MAEPFPTGYLNGEYLPLDAARISPFDRGFLFADGVYEVVPVHRGRPFLLRAHLDRLARSLAAIRIANPHTHEQWAAIVAELTSRAAAPEQLVYLQVTRGAERGRNHPFPSDVAPTVFGFTAPYPAPSPDLLAQGIAAVTREDIRWARCDIKSIALLANVLLRQEAGDSGGSEAILLREGWLTEGSSSTVGRSRMRSARSPRESSTQRTKSGLPPPAAACCRSRGSMGTPSATAFPARTGRARTARCRPISTPSHGPIPFEGTPPSFHTAIRDAFLPLDPGESVLIYRRS